MLRRCASNPQTEAGQLLQRECVNYLISFVEGAALTHDLLMHQEPSARPILCLPRSGVAGWQIVQALGTYLQEDPVMRSEPVRYALVGALVSEFGCGRRKPIPG